MSLRLQSAAIIAPDTTPPGTALTRYIFLFINCHNCKRAVCQYGMRVSDGDNYLDTYERYCGCSRLGLATHVHFVDFDLVARLSTQFSLGSFKSEIWQMWYNKLET